MTKKNGNGNGVGKKKQQLETLAQLRARHHREERELVRRALREEQWRLRRAAALLDCPPSTLQKVLAGQPELDDERRRARKAFPPLLGPGGVENGGGRPADEEWSG